MAASSCEDTNEPPAFIKGREFVDQVKSHALLKKDCPTEFLFLLKCSTLLYGDKRTDRHILYSPFIHSLVPYTTTITQKSVSVTLTQATV
jgi:hypothetical protein